MSASTSWQGYDDQQPTWSPDGERIAFISNRLGKWQIYSTDRHGMDVQVITRTATRDAYPAWSPDGKKIAYCTQRFGFWSICVVEVQQEATSVILTNNPAMEQCPVWSSDGQKIAYHSNRNGHHNIWVCDANGGRQTPLTSGDSTDFSPAWSPDGKKIAFHSNRKGAGSEQRAGSQAIWLMDADGSNLLQLTHGPENETSPAWSPDGSKIAFVAEEEGEGAIYIVDVDGSNRRRIIGLGSTCGRPAWSADGGMLAFDANSSGVFRIQTVMADGTGHVELSAAEPARAAPSGPPAPPYRRQAPTRPSARPAPQPTSSTTPRFLATQARAGTRRGFLWTLIRLLFLLGALIGIYYGATWLLGWRTRAILVEQPKVSQEYSKCWVTYTVRNGGKGGMIRARVSLTLDNGEKVEPVSLLGAHGFRAGEVKTFTDEFTVRYDREVKQVHVELRPKPS